MRLNCECDAHDYMVRAVPCKQALMHETDQSVRKFICARAAVAADGGRNDLSDTGGRRRDTADGIRSVDRRVEAGHRRAAAAVASEWQAEFAKYQAIPQYRELNRGMSLDAFKMIYWWEWSHRVLARLTGAVFLLPFLFFLWRGAIPPGLRRRLWAIFVAGAALGAVGWWMVSSGLTQGVSVSQYRLAFHLTLASAIYAAILWTAQQLATAVPERGAGAPACRRARLAALLLLQIYLGALVAGLDAGLVFNTWPTYRWRHCAFAGKAVVHSAGLAQPFRKHTHRSVQSPHGRPMRSGCLRRCTPATPGGRGVALAAP